jgi:hypothetical protein
MKSILNIGMVIIVLLSTLNSFAKIKDAVTEQVKIYGNCGTCKTAIEKAGNLKNTAKVNWNKDTKMATLTYNSKKTTRDEILKRIALAGYDSEQFLAPDDVYGKLQTCCQYNRELKPVKTVSTQHSNHPDPTQTKPVTMDQHQSSLTLVLNQYFSVKDALVNTDVVLATVKVTELVNTIKTIDAAKLSAEEAVIWKKVSKDLTANAEKMAAVKDISKQREAFASLSQNLYALAKVAKKETTVYYQYCPMFNNGAYWLSREETIKNPYYGSQMLTCGSNKETLK